uniref:Uncharacterized protein n=1 Tax=Anopheles quadriannulatus TaxID=34691 RepID=A0A182XT20_ANOQN
MAKGKQRRRRRKYITKLCEICATYDHRTVDILNKILAKYALLCIKPENRTEKKQRTKSADRSEGDEEMEARQSY